MIHPEDRVAHFQTIEAAIFSTLQDQANFDFEYRLKLYLKTPYVCYMFQDTVLRLPEFERIYGEVGWEDNFFASPEGTVDLAGICRSLIQTRNSGMTHRYAKFWSDKVIDAFIKACVDSGIHEFEMGVVRPSLPKSVPMPEVGFHDFEGTPHNIFI